MSVNKFLPHVFVLPEDDANRQLATGFLLGLDLAVHRKIQILEEAGGWREVLMHFKSDHVADMRRYPDRLMILLIDFEWITVPRLRAAAPLRLRPSLAPY